VPILKARGLAKRFGELRALEGVSFDLYPSEVLALIGQNGAGKSTLSKIISGFVAPDEGSVVVGGRDLSRMPVSERSRAIAIVAQEVSIVPTATIAENVFLGSRRSGSWRTARLARDASPYLRQAGLEHLDPRQSASTLSVAEAQLVEIARVLARDTRIIIFDEPTASLSDAEIARVESVVRTLVDSGKSVIYVTHRLAEVMRFCDAALILRNGSAVARVEIASTSLDEIVNQMLGRSMESLFPDAETDAGQVILEARDLSGRGLLDSVNLELRAGEITGLAGQLGAGTASVLRLLAGFGDLRGATVLLEGRPIRLGSPARAVGAGILYCSDDRKRDGLFAARSVMENLTSLSLPAISRGPWLVKGRERAFAAQAAAFLDVDPSRVRDPVNALSGGNQQKVALGKLACRQPSPRVLLMNEPTRGVDIGARAEIYRLIRRLAEEGMSVAFASSDVSEVLGLSDKVITFFRGRQVRTVKKADLNERQVVLDITHPQETTHG
jgi:ABC-type sugar transport system ATPase subunit